MAKAACFCSYCFLQFQCVAITPVVFFLGFFLSFLWLTYNAPVLVGFIRVFEDLHVYHLHFLHTA